MLKLIILVTALFLTSCASSNNSVERQINRSVLLDSELKLGIDGIPILEFLPDIRLGFGLHFRRPTIEQEIDLNLSKFGKTRGEKLPPPEKTSPTPFSVEGK